MPESGENRSMLGQNLASELQIKVYKEVSTVQSDITEAVDAILTTCNEPACGLTDAEVAEAREMKSSLSVVDYLNERPLVTATLLSFAAASIGVIVYLLKNSR